MTSRGLVKNDFEQIPEFLHCSVTITLKIQKGHGRHAKKRLRSKNSMAIIPRTQQGHGWLRPATRVVELSQSIIQVSDH
ncbi:unnamed protein product [Camellia sinensis]